MSSTISSYAYITSLLIALGCLVYLDHRKKIALFVNAMAWVKVIGIAVGYFLIWDILGILLNIFHTNAKFVAGLTIVSPDLPVEEILFLTFLSYFVLILYRLRARS